MEIYPEQILREKKMFYKVSLIASAVRDKLFKYFVSSLEEINIPIEIIFAGNVKDGQKKLHDVEKTNKNITCIYIETENIKPAQCYEIARRAAEGETIIWVADDCEFKGNVVEKAYKYWKEKNNEKLILSIQTKESGYNLPEGRLFDMNVHRFFGGRSSTPLMCPLALISRKFLNDLGGFDRRYICGQYENDVVMNAYSAGCQVEIFGDNNCYIDIDHYGKSVEIGESKNESDFLNRPFASGYHHDRKILENSWTENGRILDKRKDEFEPYGSNLLKESQSHKGCWI